MEKIDTWGDYLRYVSTVPRLTPAYTTNVYMSRDQVERWATEGRLRALASHNALLLLLRDRDFDHIYHMAEDRAALSAILAKLPPGVYTTDLVGKGDGLEQICSTYAQAGWVRHNFLRRMIRARSMHLSSALIPNIAPPAIAQFEQVFLIEAFLARLLDRYTEQLPDVIELEKAARAGRLLHVSRGEKIDGMLMYDVRGQTAHLRFWHVDEDARGQGVGRRLMAAFFQQCEQMQRLILWVIGDNERSIAIYRHYGFIEDGLLDQIMILRNERV
jgi:ribosomal protein S18 acetylase RimI-like enzyme